ncbi:ABC transporter permease [Brevibacillus choshinensis]|uniref:Peptide ABC transporter permease n=1 Tax=Brevibacillus choshinensis TaxID=54911 RepID=A0ABR5NEA3_BRECH|nr:ABC transporter permease [Brevibacillus choshinensis]KQL49873.1 peptide ABC transporter permease [Brevibacillus choshinensis]MED4582436.1 ABC transporter permease [Brevibacillus choshinensis]MED4750505.1 ABC transporter permease [Brevibacillus choshinensis]MED4781122.1 ABC transporter permease [Brevibacillus choshinensis]
MTNFLIARLLRGVVTVLVAVTATFLILRVMPGDPTTMMLDNRVPEEIRQQLLKDFGLDKDLFTQYIIFLKQLFFQFDLGTSFVQRVPVMDVILSRLPWTLILMSVSMLITTLIGIPLGVIAAYRKGSFLDQAINALSILGIALFIPWLGIILLYFLGLKIPWFPIGGAVTVGVEGWDYIWDATHHLVLPVVSLTIVHLASYVLYMRASTIDVLNEEYIRTARAKGLKERVVLWRHAVRNSLLSTVTMMGLQLGAIVGGAILTETVFAYPGLGRLIYEAVKEHDYPILQGTFLILAVTVVVVNILTDIVYSYLDPKITYN